MKSLETLYFKDTYGLVNSVLEKYETYKIKVSDDEFIGVSIVAPYEVLIDVLNYIVKTTSFKMKNIHLEDGECADYWDEWIMTIDPDGQIWVQVAKYETGYIFTEDNAVFVHSNVNSAFVKKNEKMNLVVYEIGEKERKLEEPDSAIHYFTDEDRKTHGFSASKSDENSYMSYSFTTTENLNIDMISDLLKSFGFY